MYNIHTEKRTYRKLTALSIFTVGAHLYNQHPDQEIEFFYLPPPPRTSLMPERSLETVISDCILQKGELRPRKAAGNTITYLFLNYAHFGAPGWLRWWSIWLRLRSWSRLAGSSLVSGCVLTAQSLEPALDSVSSSLSVPPLFSVSQKNKIKH